MPGEAHRIRNGYGTQMSDGGNDNATGSVTGDDFGLNDDNIMPGRSGAESGSAASSTEMTDTAASGSNAGMAFGIILAILVIIAVVVLVMLFMPKKRG